MKPDGNFSGLELVASLRHPECLRDLPLRRWDNLLRVARRANLIGRLALAARQAGLLDDLPAPVRTHLQSAEVLTTHQRAAIGWETGHLAKAFAAEECPIVLLKGAAYASAGLAAANGRLFGDVDILVPRADLNRAEAALMLHGWGSGGNDPYDERYYRQWMHEIPPMMHRGRGTLVDLHHNILPPTARRSPDAAALLAASQPLPGTRFRILCPADMVIHSATHLFYESELQNGLRDLFDLDALLGEFAAANADFWEQLLARASVLGLALPLYLACRFCQRLLGTAIPPQVLAALEQSANPGSGSLRILDAIYSHALLPEHPLNHDAATALAHFAIYLRGHALRMPPGLLLAHLSRKLFMRLFRNTSRSG
ncbi:MAG: nucleotidyltransferase family protein [Betaproteobacteria bacterium]|nr:nucleotidyltransferase family protein [Betaproteobacteria bacterium]MCL2886419.1 nucleotidyltransferase family protein [Betaproteobacteria bacterium]